MNAKDRSECKTFEASAVLSAILWALLGLAVLRNQGQSRHSFHFLELWALTMGDLWATSRLVLGLFETRTGNPDGVRPAILGGLTKLTCLGCLAVVLWGGQSIPSMVLALGVSTLAAVPLIGGTIGLMIQEISLGKDRSLGR